MFIILRPQELINNLKDKGVVFEQYSERDAIHFLCEHNYYTKLTAYRKNFPKYNDKYVGLDFKALVDLSTIDMYLKESILKACLNIEHALKVNLLRDIQKKDINEFDIVQIYFSSYSRILDEINARRKNGYVKDLLHKYTHPNYPIWVLFEVIPFGEFVNFYRFYCERYHYNSLEYNIFYNVRDIRNAAAHNNCIIHNLADKNGFFIKSVVDHASLYIKDTKKRTVQDRLKNKSVQDFVSLLISLDTVLKSDELKKRNLKEFTELFKCRMVRNADLYKSAPALYQMYEFCNKIIDTLNDKAYTSTTN